MHRIELVDDDQEELRADSQGWTLDSQSTNRHKEDACYQKQVAQWQDVELQRVDNTSEVA